MHPCPLMPAFSDTFNSTGGVRLVPLPSALQQPAIQAPQLWTWGTASPLNLWGTATLWPTALRCRRVMPWQWHGSELPMAKILPIEECIRVTWGVCSVILNAGCPEGKFGVNCLQSCSCGGSPCDQATGKCRCLPGKTGHDCGRGKKTTGKREIQDRLAFLICGRLLFLLHSNANLFQQLLFHGSHTHTLHLYFRVQDTGSSNQPPQIPH